MKNKSIYIILLFIFSVLNLNADNFNPQLYFNESYSRIELMLSSNEKIDLKKAVFLVENAYYQEQLKEQRFNNIISEENSCTQLNTSGLLTQYLNGK